MFERSIDMLLFRDDREVGLDSGGDVGEVGESAVGDSENDISRFDRFGNFVLTL